MVNQSIFFFVTIVFGNLVGRCIPALPQSERAPMNWDALQSQSFTRWVYRRTSREEYLREEKTMSWFGIVSLLPMWLLFLWFLVIAHIS